MISESALTKSKLFHNVPFPRLVNLNISLLPNKQGVLITLWQVENTEIFIWRRGVPT